MKKFLLPLLLLTIPLAAQVTVTPNIGLQVPFYNMQNWQVPIQFDLNQLDLLLSGNQPLPGINTWVATYTYPSGAVVTYSGAPYVSLQTANIGNNPSSSALWWFKLPLAASAFSIIPGTNITCTPLVGGACTGSSVTINGASTLSTPFGSLSSSTNISAAMGVGSGASIFATGTGTIAATSVPYSGLTGTVPTWNQNTSGTAAGLSANISESQVTNLIADLSGKQAVLGFTPYNATNPAGYITSSSLPGFALTTTGTSGAATLTGSVLNIPQYAGGSGSTGISGLTAGQLGVAGSSTTITSSVPYATAATASTIVERDSSSNINAASFTGSLIGNAGTATNLVAAAALPSGTTIIGMTSNVAVLSFGYAGTPPASQYLGSILPTTLTYTVPSGCTGSYAYGSIASSTTDVFQINKCTAGETSCSSVGTVTFTSSATGVFSCSAFTVTPGQSLNVTAPSSAATIVNPTFSIHSTHN